MKSMLSLSLFLCSLLSLSSTVNASIYYRHVPFKVFVKIGDTLIVDYDFSGKNSVFCHAHGNPFLVDFVYKGHPKKASLPVNLESDHVPHKKGEELADMSGQLTLESSKKIDHLLSEISCSYGESDQ